MNAKAFGRLVGEMCRRALVITLSILGASCIGRCSEDVETHYATSADARADMAFERGWLPPIVPRNAFDIWEFHNIDSNRTWACFSVPDGPAATRALLLKTNLPIKH